MKIIDLQKKDFLDFQKNIIAKNFTAFSSFPAWPFLQSDKWADIQKKTSDDIFLKVIYQEEKALGFFLAIEKKIPGGFKYLYLPRGPLVFENYQGNFWNDFYEASRLEFKKKKVLFIRVEPNDNNFKNFVSSNRAIVKKSRDIQPASTSFLDLSPSSDELLKKMNQKSRYNIRLADKRGVVVSGLTKGSLNYEKHFADFYNLIFLTAKRDKFFIHSRNYYNNLIDGDFIRLFEARKDGVLLAAGIFSFYKQTVTYLHGASSNEMRELMAPHLLQWKIINLAKEEGYRYYDFYGIDEKKWPGVSRFKKGFAGEILSYPGTFDILYHKNLYLVYNLIRKLRLMFHF